MGAQRIGTSATWTAPGPSRFGLVERLLSSRARHRRPSLEDEQGDARRADADGSSGAVHERDRDPIPALDPRVRGERARRGRTGHGGVEPRDGRDGNRPIAPRRDVDLEGPDHHRNADLPAGFLLGGGGVNPDAHVVASGERHGAVEEPLEGEGLAWIEERGLDGAHGPADVGVAGKGDTFTSGCKGCVQVGDGDRAGADVLDVDGHELTRNPQGLRIVVGAGRRVHGRSEIREVPHHGRGCGRRRHPGAARGRDARARCAASRHGRRSEQHGRVLQGARRVGPTPGSTRVHGLRVCSDRAADGVATTRALAISWSPMDADLPPFSALVRPSAFLSNT